MDREYKSSLRCLKIGDKVAELPIIQGGMGVGVSRSSLAGAVAAEGGVGVISTAQIGYDEAGFEKDQAGCNLKAIRKHIWKAREIAKGKGLVGVNIMVALKHYKEHVKEAVECGADVIISGAGLPMNLPELVPEFCRTKIAPIVSSKRAANLILKMWAHRYNRTADLVRVFLQDLPANAVKSRVSDSQYTVLTLKLNIFLLSKCFDYKRIRAFFVLPHQFHCSLFMRIVT